MQTVAIRSPYSGLTLAELPLSGPAEALEKLASARAWPKNALPRSARIAVLRGAAGQVRARAEELGLQIAREGGKPLLDARVEVARAAAGLDYLAGEVERLAGSEIAMGATAATEGRLAFTTLEPIGVVFAISAFNHPLNLIVHQVGPAIAAGCPVIVKPALETPLSCLALLSILREAGLPDGFAQALLCDNATAELCARDPKVAFVTFIGSAAVGWKLRALVAPGTRIALEHGGAAPVVVDKTADLDAAAALITKGGYYHAGQVCVSVQRVIVHRDVYAAFRGKLAERVAALRVLDPTDAESDVGPLIRPRELDRLDTWIDEAKQGGARLVVGSGRLDHQCYSPTLLEAVPPEARVLTHEVFGPVVSLIEVESLDAAIAEANRSRWSFQAAVFTGALDSAMKCARELDAAAVMVNDHTAFRADWMPFGGRHESGLGTGGLPYAVGDLSAHKLVVIRAS